MNSFLLFFSLIDLSYGLEVLKQEQIPQEELFKMICSQYKGHVISYKLDKEGKWLDCVIVSNSHRKLKNFYEHREVYSHSLENMLDQERKNICYRNYCSESPIKVPVIEANSTETSKSTKWFGKLIIRDGYVHKKLDTFSEADIYVKIYKDKVFIASTEVDHGSDHPKFNQTFDIPDLDLSTTVKLKMYDFDPIASDDHYCSTSIKINQFIAENKNATMITQKCSKGWLAFNLTLFS